MPAWSQGMSNTVLITLAGLLLYWTNRLGRILLIYWRTSRSPLCKLLGPQGTPSWIAGHTAALSSGEAMAALDRWTRDYGDNFVIRGPFGTNILVTADLRALTHVLSASDVFQHPAAERRGVEIFLGTQGVLWAQGEQHTKQRRILNPAFGHAQMREMTPMFLENSAKLRDIWTNMCVAAGGTAQVDAVEWFGKAALATISRAGFDYDAGTLDEHGGTSKMAKAVNDIFRMDFKTKHFVQFILYTYVPYYSKLFPNQVIRRVERWLESIEQVGTEILRDKKATTPAGSSSSAKGLPGGKDIISLLLRTNHAADLHPSMRLSDAEVLAQISTFIFAGSETTGKTASWAIYSLAKYPEMQARLRTELQTVDTATPALDLLNSLSYLDHVVRETIRLYNTVSYFTREVVKDDLIPLERPVDGRDGTSKLSHISIQKGDQVIVPIWLVNRSQRTWGPDANEFRPERWDNLPEGAPEIPGITPGLMSFGGGPRACIGHRFAVAEVKTLLFHIVRGFEIRLAVPPDGIWARSGRLLRPQLRSDNSVQLPITITPIA